MAFRRRLTPLPRPRRRRLLCVVAVLALVTGTLLALPGGGGASAAAVAGSPAGSATEAFHPGKMHYYGWVVDPNTVTAVSVYFTVDGKKVGSTVANLANSASLKKYPKYGTHHAYNLYLPITEGWHTVCTYAVNKYAGKNTTLLCKRTNVQYSPILQVDNLQAAPGGVYLRGWAIDQDLGTKPVTLQIKVDGKITSIKASKSRPDLAKIHPSYGPLHGFALTVPTSQGKHTVCLTAPNVGYGKTTNAPCKTITVNGSPAVHINTLGRYRNGIQVIGWDSDPDSPKMSLTTTITIDSKRYSMLAQLNRSDVAKAYPSDGAKHGFSLTKTGLAAGSHKVCVIASSVLYGSNGSYCKTVVLNYTPAVGLSTVTATTTGVTATGWATDPDTSSAIKVRYYIGSTTETITANGAGGAHPGHAFTATLMTSSGTRTVCAVAINAGYGTSNSPAACKTISPVFSPVGAAPTLARASGGRISFTGWALDSDTRGALTITATLDGKAIPSVQANAYSAYVAKTYPSYGGDHGYAGAVAATDGEHTLCLTAVNVGAGTNKSLGCKVINAVHPAAPSPPQSVKATTAYGSATISWTKPASDGGAPWTSYVVSASPGGATRTVGATTTSTTLSLAANTAYTFSVVAVNVAGRSAAGKSPSVRTPSGPPPQTTPAPVSTSRYTRNLHGTSADLALMKREGAADAAANPSGHSYLMLLDIGGQDQADGGVVLSAGVRFVSYKALVADIEAYVDGYASKQKSTAPAVIALGTNNDMDVSTTSGAAWANVIVDPVLTYAKKYANIRIAGADDMEPGFRGTYTQTRNWLTGYLGATSAGFVFNGSADGCSPSATNRACNNGWSMAGLYQLAAGAASSRIINLPQVYNTTMAGQWKYISLTGVAAKHPRINFGGVLTEWTACDQAGGCGSLTGHTAWSTLWSRLQSDSRLNVATLPYSTDLRIDSG